MCFRKTSLRGKAQIVKDDIIGFKLLKGAKYLSSPFQKGFMWESGKVNIAKDFDKKAKGYNVNEGFHCFRTYKDALDYRLNQFVNASVYIVRIPKGAHVYANKTEFCANKMILEPLSLNKEVFKKAKTKS